MLEKVLLGTLAFGMLLAYGLTKSMETDRTRVVASDPHTVTIELRR